MRFVAIRSNSSGLTKQLRAELEQAWLVIDGKDRELAAVHDQTRQLRQLLASERQRVLQLEAGHGQAFFPRRVDATADLRTQNQQDQKQISQLKEALQVLGEQLDAAHYRIMELTNQQAVVRGERPHLVSDNDAPLSNQAG